MSEVLKLQKIRKDFQSGEEIICVLNGIDLSIQPGESFSLIGQSGAGKSTLLQIMALLRAPTSGQIFINGVNMGDASDSLRTFVRRKNIGFVYQFHHLLPEFSALENVIMPQIITGVTLNDATNKALDLLESVGLSHRINQIPSELSGGEQQRVAIARSLANTPSLIIADEPTGSLDPKTSDMVFELLLSLLKIHKIAALIATHNYNIASKLDKTLRLEDGKIIGR